MKTVEEMRDYKRRWNRKTKGTTKESLAVSTTWKGRRAEYLAKEILTGSIDNNLGTMNKSFDLMWNGLRVDVKSCNFYKRKDGKRKTVCGQWVFNKNKGESDFYFCVCMIKNIPIKYYLIPREIFGGGITVGHISKKFDKYIINI